MDEDELDREDHGTRPARINWADIAYTTVAFLSGIAEAGAISLGYLRAALAQHSALLVEQDDFKRGVGRDLESIPVIHRGDGL